MSHPSGNAPQDEMVIPRRNSSRPAPLSSGQELFWLLDRASPGLTAYNVPRAFRIRGALNADALERAVQALATRHEILRSVYTVEGDQPVQLVLHDAAVPFERIDLGGLPAGQRLAEAERLMRERAIRHFDLAKDVLLRGALLRLADDDHVFFLLTHHIASDGWSKSVTFRELNDLYSAFASGQPSNLPPLRIQFADYAAWERDVLAGEELERRLAYWRDKLHGPLPVLDLPTDRPREGSHNFEGDFREIVLPHALVKDLRHLGEAHGASLYMVLLAAYQSLLHRYSGQDDVIVGSPTAGRELEDTHPLIGYFANALVLRTSFAGDPAFGELLERVTNSCLDAYEHQDLPFEKLVLELQKGEQLTHAPLFQCVLTMEDTVPAELGLGDTVIEPVDVFVTETKFDLTLLFGAQPDGLRLRLAFRTALFDGDRVERMLGHLRTFLDAVVRNPALPISGVPMLTPAERTTLLTEWNATDWDEGPATTMTALIEAQAARVPLQPAVVGPEGTSSWAELNAQANRIAGWLIERGAGPGTTVGLCLDRSAAMIAGLLGVFKAGAAYVPLLPDLPPARLAQQLRDGTVGVVVTSAAHQALLPDGIAALRLDADAVALAALPATNPPPRGTPGGLAYVLFTSGSTGVPKGVGVTHANLVHYTRAIARRIGLGLDRSGDPWHFATVSTLGADLGHTAVFPALASGGTLHVLPAPVTTDPARFAEYVAAHPLDLLKITPNHLRALLAGGAPAPLLPRKWLVLGGEACPADFAEALRAACRGRVLNHYGPTETTVGVCTYEVQAGTPSSGSRGTVPIGRPLSNTRAYVLDPRGEPAPIGVPGELFIGGAGVAQGYVGQDELTRQRFQPDRFGPRSEGRLYRTGDRVRWLSRGELEFLGRVDDQVKIRGFRVEPGEIEAALLAHPGMRQAAVRALAGSDGSLRLVSYLAGDGLPDDAAMAGWLGQRIPDYMVPAQWVRLPQLPLTTNGKVDRQALPVPPADEGSDRSGGTAPRTEAERTIAGHFAEVLKRPAVGIDEDFFALGGHSLLAIRLLGKISKAFGVRLALRALFDAPTVAGLARALDPESPLEIQLAALFAEVLKRERVGRDESFFDLGGHSLLAIRLLGKISKAVGIRLPLRALFDAPTARQLAAVVTEQVATAEGGAAR